jgi:hypothetical protein
VATTLMSPDPALLSLLWSLQHGVAALGNSLLWCRKNPLKSLRQRSNRPNADRQPGLVV